MADKELRDRIYNLLYNTVEHAVENGASEDDLMDLEGDIVRIVVDEEYLELELLEDSKIRDDDVATELLLAVEALVGDCIEDSFDNIVDTDSKADREPQIRELADSCLTKARAILDRIKPTK